MCVRAFRGFAAVVPDRCSKFIALYCRAERSWLRSHVSPCSSGYPYRSSYTTLRSRTLPVTIPGRQNVEIPPVQELVEEEEISQVPSWTGGLAGGIRLFFEGYYTRFLCVCIPSPYICICIYIYIYIYIYYMHISYYKGIHTCIKVYTRTYLHIHANAFRYTDSRN